MKKNQIVFSLTQNQVFGLKGAVFLMLFISKSALFEQHKEEKGTKFFHPLITELECSYELVSPTTSLLKRSILTINSITELPKLGHARLNTFCDWNIGHNLWDYTVSFDPKISKIFYGSVVVENDFYGEYRRREHLQLGGKAYLESLPILKKHISVWSVAVNYSLLGAQNRVGEPEFAFSFLSKPHKVYGKWEIGLYSVGKIRIDRNFVLTQIFVENERLPLLLMIGTAKFQKTNVFQDDYSHKHTVQFFMGINWSPRKLNLATAH